MGFEGGRNGTMRTHRLLLALVASALLPSLALADDATAEKKKDSNINCTITADKDDRVAQGHDLLLDDGTKAKDAVVLHGNVTIKKGATVEKVVAISGNVFLEPGAHVKGDVVALGGDVRVAEDVRIDGDLTALGGHLYVDGKAKVTGKRFAIGGIEIDGEDIAQKLIREALANEKHCKVTRK